MPLPTIRTPRGEILFNRKGTKARITWNKNFSPKWNSKYRRAQFAHDKQAYEECEPFTPRRTGALILSGKLGTIFGTGQLRWIAFYAAHQYFNPRLPSDSSAVIRGPFWFERMKAVRGRAVIDNTIKIFLHAR